MVSDLPILFNPHITLTLKVLSPFFRAGEPNVWRNKDSYQGCIATQTKTGSQVRGVGTLCSCHDTLCHLSPIIPTYLADPLSPPQSGKPDHMVCPEGGAKYAGYWGTHIHSLGCQHLQGSFLFPVNLVCLSFPEVTMVPGK